MRVLLTLAGAALAFTPPPHQRWSGTNKPRHQSLVVACDGRRMMVSENAKPPPSPEEIGSVARAVSHRIPHGGVAGHLPPLTDHPSHPFNFFQSSEHSHKPPSSPSSLPLDGFKNTADHSRERARRTDRHEGAGRAGSGRTRLGDQVHHLGFAVKHEVGVAHLVRRPVLLGRGKQGEGKGGASVANDDYGSVNRAQLGRYQTGSPTRQDRQQPIKTRNHGQRRPLAFTHPLYEKKN